MAVKNNCLFCGKSFLPKTATSKYCSRVCISSMPSSYELPELKPEEWGYIAGFIDADGCIYKRVSYTYKQKNIYHFRISFTHTCLETLVWLCEKLKTGNIYERKGDLKNFSKKKQYHLDIGRHVFVYKILERIIPLLREKKSRAEDVVSFMKENNILPINLRGE